MKTITTKKIISAMGISSLAILPLIAGPSVPVQIGAPAPPPPAVMAPPVYPENYVWDGYEYVGVIGSDYYYLGPGNVWLTLDVERQARFHQWEHVHANWREHAIRNERYHNPTLRQEERHAPDDHRYHPPTP
jgi:hypothetical protein